MSHDPHHEPLTEGEYHETLHEHDEWFRHSPDEPAHQEAHGRTSAGIILAFLFGTLVVVAVTGVLVFQLWLQMTQEVVIQNEERRTNLSQLLSARADWERQNSQFGLIEGAPGRAKVPLDLAMKLVIEDYARNAKK